MKIPVTIAMILSLLICWMIRESGMNPDQGGLAVGCILAGLITGWAISEAAHLNYAKQALKSAGRN